MELKLLRDVKALDLKKGYVLALDGKIGEFCQYGVINCKESIQITTGSAETLLELGAAKEVKDISPEAQELAREVIGELEKRETELKKKHDYYLGLSQGLREAISILKEKFQL